MSIAVRLPEHVAGGRRRFISDLKSVAGAGTARVLYMPSYGEGTTTVDGAVATRVWTHANTPVGRLSALGKGVALSFNGTSDMMSTPDANDVSFGTGAADTPPFSFFAVVKVTDTAAARVIIAKDDNAGAAREWSIFVGATDLDTFQIFDQSAAVSAARNSDAAVAQGSWATLSGSYSVATGGATAANDITLYQNGAVVASTATNNAAYVAMENLGMTCTIGSSQATPSAWFAGSIALVLLVGANLSAGQHFQLNQLSRRFFGI